MPPAMILCGGKGTRLRDVTELLPKPMVPIGDRPILWHIMKGYAAFGVKRFILCLGYKREVFIDYFLHIRALSADITICPGKKDSIVYHGATPETDWEITLADTGIETMTGGRVRIAGKYLEEDEHDFFLTYGDAVSDVNLKKLLDFHRKAGKLMTVSAVHPEGRFGEMRVQEGSVVAFEEKRARTDGFINGGYMVLKKEFLSRYLSGTEDFYLEALPMQRALRDGEIAACCHNGFWQCMDTPREHELLNRMWAEGNVPWTKYWDKQPGGMN